MTTETADQSTLIEHVTEMGRRARQAARQLAWMDGAVKNSALEQMARSLLDHRSALQKANAEDLAMAEENGLTSAMIDRLRLTDARINEMARGIRQLIVLPDPVGEMAELKRLSNGLQVGRMRVPLGVIGIIYESRPNVTADAASLCVKSGNAVILRGGSEAHASNRAIANALSEGLLAANVPGDVVQMIQERDRAAVGALLRNDRDVDVIIPRGGKGLITRVMEESRIPVIKHLDGICHTYIDRDADIDMASDLVFNGKMQRTGVCNATETVLIHKHAATGSSLLPTMTRRLHEAGCALRGCETTRSKTPSEIPVRPATEEDWDTEYLAPVLALRVVDTMDQALAHIEQHSSRHTEVIVTENHRRALRFLREVDSSAVMVNASSRFNDGFQLGLGAEMGISTDKLHVRGPVGLEGLTTLKYIVFGDGHLRS